MMKYIKPPDFKSVREFQAYYRSVEEEINTLLVTDGSASSAEELNKKLSQALSAAVSYLSKKNQEFTKNELATAFREGRENVKEPVKVSAKEAADVLEKQGYKYAKNGLTRDVYIELQNATQSAGNGLKTRVNSIIEDLRKTREDTVYNVQQAILKDLQKNGLLTVEYANGAKQPLYAYAAMAARSARIESANIGSIGRALQAGTDLVKMTTMPQCCKLCGAYQGKVYCISGKDKRFPALFKTVLRSGYALPHPNCRHEFIPWFEEIEAPEDVEKAIKDSKIKYDKKGNLVDVRFQKDIKSYAAWQAGNRQLNRELLEYDRMKAYYESKGEQPPYKTLGTFRRARRAQTETYRLMRNTVADTLKYVEKVPKPKGYNQEIIKNNNYQKKFEQIVDTSISRKVTIASREVVSENNRMNEETVIAITLLGERVLKQHSKGLVLEVDMHILYKQPIDGVVLIHNHPQNDSFSAYDLRFMSNRQIHTLIASCHDGRVFSLRTNCGKIVDEWIVSEYNRYIDEGMNADETLIELSQKYGWEYKTL